MADRLDDGDGHSHSYGGLTMRVVVLAIFMLFFGALQLVPGVGVREAWASTGPDGVFHSCESVSYDAKPSGCTREIAWQQCDVVAQWFKSPAGGNHSGAVCYLYATIYSGTWFSYRVRRDSNYVFPDYFNGGACPAGSTWNEDEKKCLSPAICLARNTGLGANAGLPRPSLTTSRCVAGCTFAMDTTGDNYSATSWQGQTLYRGVMEYTGGLCSPDPPILPDGEEADQKDIPPQECIPVGGQSVCVKPNGDTCYSGPIGRPMQFCWRAGETGSKSSGDVEQVRAAGSTAPTAPAPPPGDSFNSADAPMQTNATLGSGISIGTIVQNFTTSSGTNAGSSNQAETPDGSGTPVGGTGNGDGNPDDDGSVSGGDDCSAPPVVDGGNPLEAATIRQIWLANCKDQAGLSADVDSAIANVQAGLDQFDADSDPNNFGFGSGFDSLASGHNAEDVAGAEDTGTDGLDASGFLGAGTCPTIPPLVLGGHEFPFNFDPLCGLLVNIGSLLVAFCYFVAARAIATS